MHTSYAWAAHTPWWSVPRTQSKSHSGVPLLHNDGHMHVSFAMSCSQLQPLSWLDGKRVVFGKVIDQAGLELLRAVEQLPTNNERPLPEVTISSIQQVA